MEQSPRGEEQNPLREAARVFVDDIVERNDGDLGILAERERWERAAIEAQELAGALYRLMDTLLEMEEDGDHRDTSARVYKLQRFIGSAVEQTAYKRGDAYGDYPAEKLADAFGAYVKDRIQETAESRETKRIEWWSREGYLLRRQALETIKRQLADAPEHTIHIERPEQLTEEIKLILHTGKRISGLPYGATFTQVGRSVRLSIRLEDDGEMFVESERAERVTGDYEPDSPMHTWPMEWNRGSTQRIYETLDIITIEEQRAAYDRLVAMAGAGKVEWTQRSQIPEDVQPILKDPGGEWRYFPLFDLSDNAPVSVSFHGDKLSLVSWDVRDGSKTVSNIYDIPFPKA